MPSKSGVGGPVELIDPNVFSSAVFHPQHVNFYTEECSAFDLAAEYAFSIGRKQAFRDGNKRTAAAVAIAFLDVNGWTVYRSFTDDLLALVKDEMSKSEFSAELKVSLGEN